jgi:hypothetical protein
MRKIPMVFLVFAILLLLPPPAAARDMRFPEKSLPAFTFFLPDDWTARPNADGNLIMASANRTTSMVIIVAESTDALDVIAAEAFGVAKADPSSRQEPAEISGHKGFTYYSSITNAKGIRLNLETTIVRVGEKHIAAASLLYVANPTKEDETTARLVRNGVKLVTE